MTYEQAAALVAQHAPELHLDAPVPGLQHVNLRKTENGPPFSIMLPVMMGDDAAAQEEKAFTDAISAAKSMLNA